MNPITRITPPITEAIKPTILRMLRLGMKHPKIPAIAPINTKRAPIVTKLEFLKLIKLKPFDEPRIFSAEHWTAETNNN